MMTLAAVDAKLSRAPGRTLVLEPWCFADEWAKKPKAAVCVGLRLMSDGQKTTARAESERLALELHPDSGPNQIDAFNDLLVRYLVAFGICDPNDVHQPWAMMELAEEEVRLAFTSRGARFAYEAINRYEIESSPLSPEIADDELEELSEKLHSGALRSLPTAEQIRARKLLQYVLDEIREG